jgi:hypothetical protein
VHADREPENECDEDQELILAAGVFGFFPHTHEPYDEGGEEGAGGIDFGFNGVEPH